MATVFFSSELQRFTGEEKIEVSAQNYRELLAELTIKFPELRSSEIDDMAIAIDGEIVHEPLLESIPQNAELHFFHFIAGG
ncbi:MAG: sulfur carrier protein ThiS [Candidatus Azotimanducaceae bacterium]|jgi:sulfur carrier protein ThiS